jgi:hypothetical protein
MEMQERSLKGRKGKQDRKDFSKAGKTLERQERLLKGRRDFGMAENTLERQERLWKGTKDF